MLPATAQSGNGLSDQEALNSFQSNDEINSTTKLIVVLGGGESLAMGVVLPAD